MEGLTDHRAEFDKYKKYAEAWNHDWDGNRASHDLTLILNGQDMSGQRTITTDGIACVDCACQLYAFD